MRPRAQHATLSDGRGRVEARPPAGNGAKACSARRIRRLGRLAVRREHDSASGTAMPSQSETPGRRSRSASTTARTNPSRRSALGQNRTIREGGAFAQVRELVAYLARDARYVLSTTSGMARETVTAQPSAIWCTDRRFDTCRTDRRGARRGLADAGSRGVVPLLRVSERAMSRTLQGG